MFGQNTKKIPWWFQIYYFLKTFFTGPFFKDKFILLLFFLSLFINIGTWIYLKVSLAISPLIIVLRYRVYEGAVDINNSQMAFNLPFFSLLILVINIVLAYFLYKKEAFMSKLLMYVSFFSQIIFLAASITVIKNLP